MHYIFMPFSEFRLLTESISTDCVLTKDGKRIMLGDDIINEECCELVSVYKLDKLKLADRRKEPKVDVQDSSAVIDELKTSFLNEGIQSPVVIVYYTYDSCAVMVEGNHRLIAAMELRIEQIPAIVLVKKEKCPIDLKLKSIQVQGYQNLNDNFVPGVVKPSDIGL